MVHAEGSEATAGLNPLFERLFAWVETTAVMAAAEVGLPDVLAVGPQGAEAVASQLGAEPDAVARLLRILAGAGIVAGAGDGRFSLTDHGSSLRSDVPGSLRAGYRMMGGPMSRALLAGDVAVRSAGTTAFEGVLGVPIWDYMAAHPADAAVFNDAMVNFGATVGMPAIDAYDFSWVHRLVDVGGGLGQLALEVLRRTPSARAVVYDTPPVAADARAAIEAAGLADRCEAMGGDFLESVPDGDCHTLRFIVHFLPDDLAVRLLTNCRKALDPAGRLLLFELVVPADDEAHLARAVDWIMLTCPGGRERTATEYATLLAHAGFQLQREIPSAGPLSVLEAVPL